MKKNLTKKLMLSVLTLAFAVVSLGASTFAWFTIEKDANVEQFSADVVSGAGIELAVGAINSSIQVASDGTITTNGVVSEFAIGTLSSLDVKKAVLNNAAATEATAWKELNNVSTAADGITASTFAGTFYDVKKEEITDGAGFYAFKLYIRSELDGQVKLSNFALTSDSTIAPWAAGVAYTDGLGENITADEKVSYSVVSAARLAFICNEHTEVYQAPAGSGKGGNSVGLSDALEGALKVYNAKYENETTNQLAVLEGTEIPSWETTAKDWTGAELTLNVDQDSIYEIKVYVWLEGYDNECYNAIFSQAIKSQFTFTWVE